MPDPSHFDPSYSPNERAEMAHNEPNCSHCLDSGYLQDDNGQELHCECPEGDVMTRLDALDEECSYLSVDDFSDDAEAWASCYGGDDSF